MRILIPVVLVLLSAPCVSLAAQKAPIMGACGVSVQIDETTYKDGYNTTRKDRVTYWSEWEPLPYDMPDVTNRFWKYLRDEYHVSKLQSIANPKCLRAGDRGIKSLDEAIAIDLADTKTQFPNSAVKTPLRLSKPSAP